MKRGVKKTQKKLTQADIKRNSSTELEHVISRIKTREIRMMVIVVSIILVVLLAGSYLLFSTVQKREKFNTIQIGVLKVDFQEMKNGLGDVVYLDQAFIFNDKQGLKTKPYYFNVTNISDERVDYRIRLLDDNDMIQADGCEKQSLDKSFIRYSIDKVLPRTLSETEDVEYEIATGTLDSKSSTTYSLQLWINKKNVGEHHYHGKISIEIIEAKKTA